MLKIHGKSKKGLAGPLLIIRLFLSLIIFLVLILGLYSAYKEFSGRDPLQIDPQAVLLNVIAHKDITELRNLLPKSGIASISQLQTINSPDYSAEPQIAGTSGKAKLEGGLEENLSHSKNVQFNFLLVSDSHNESNYLQKALRQGKERVGAVEFVIGLGDYTEVGTVDELKKAKQVFDEFGVRYFLTAGDHDLWDSRDKQRASEENFVAVFGLPYQSFTVDNIRLILIYNSDNYSGLGQDQTKWLEEELVKSKNDPAIKSIFVFLHEPLYHPSSSRVMGKTDDKLKTEARNTIRLLKNSGVKDVFAGDIHYFTRYVDPETNLQMTTLGAVASLRNTQNPRYAIVTVFDDGSHEIEDVEIK